MKKFRIKNLDKTPNCSTVVNNCIRTADGLEAVHVNMATGEITYSKGACVDEQLLRESFSREGLELEEKE